MKQHRWCDKKRNWPQVKAAMCKDDSTTEVYWEQRMEHLFNSKVINLGSGFDRTLLWSQNFKCPICSQDLYSEEGLGPIHRHHIIPRSNGGLNTLQNMTIIHLDCHILYTFHYAKDKALLTSQLLEYKSKTNLNKEEKEKLKKIYPF